LRGALTEERSLLALLDRERLAVQTQRDFLFLLGVALGEADDAKGATEFPESSDIK
jgi:hypothetical protein